MMVMESTCHATQALKKSGQGRIVAQVLQFWESVQIIEYEHKRNC